MLLLNLRGCQGSGKTSAALSLLTGRHPSKLTTTPISEWPTPHGEFIGSDTNNATASIAETPEGHRVYTIGPYPPPKEPGHLPCGGMDKCRTFDRAEEQIEWAVNNLAGTRDIILFESGIASTTYERWRALDEKLYNKGHETLWAFLDTPPDVCLSRVTARSRHLANPSQKNLLRLHRAVMKTREKAIADGLYVYDVPHKNPRTALRCIIEGRASRYEAS